MAGVKRSDFTEGMKRDSYSYFWEAYPQTPPKYEQIFDVIPSDAAYEKFSSAIGLGELLEKPEDEDIEFEAPIESYTIICANKSFARGTKFSYESMKDSKKSGNLLQNAVASWSQKLPITKEKFYAKFFNYGANGAGTDVFNNTITGVIDDTMGASGYIYDGDYFFSTSHTSKGGTDYSNYNSSYTLTKDNLETVYLQYTTTNNRDERDDRIELIPDVLLIPPALKFTAQTILNSTLIPGNQDNDVNTMYQILTPMEWAYLTDTDGWFMGKLRNGLLATNREDVTLDFWQDETSKRYYATIFTRFGGCINQWRHWIANAI
jgi:hypothetical protein